MGKKHTAHLESHVAAGYFESLQPPLVLQPKEPAQTLSSLHIEYSECAK